LAPKRFPTAVRRANGGKELPLKGPPIVKGRRVWSVLNDAGISGNPETNGIFVNRNRVEQMKHDRKLLNLLIVLAFFTVQTVTAETDAEKAADSESTESNFELPDVDLYRQPYVPNPTVYDRLKDCRQLELELRALQPKTYSYKPGFYEDPKQGAALWVGTTMFWPAYGVVAWSAVTEYDEQGRKINSENRIAELQQLKADLRCFED
jgi:hypothetical protein